MEARAENLIRTEYSEVMQKAYIDYAMSVIIARALPDVRDGLKPVQRRTLYDMHWWMATVILARLKVMGRQPCVIPRQGCKRSHRKPI